MESDKKRNSNDVCNDKRKLEENNGFDEYDMLRNAYELIFENSQFFWEELAIAFNIQCGKTNA